MVGGARGRGPWLDRGATAGTRGDWEFGRKWRRVKDERGAHSLKMRRDEIN